MDSGRGDTNGRFIRSLTRRLPALTGSHIGPEAVPYPVPITFHPSMISFQLHLTASRLPSPSVSLSLSLSFSLAIHGRRGETC